MSTTDTAPLATTPAPTKPSPVIKTVLQRFEVLKERGLDLPSDYSASNALTQAQLLLPTIVDKNDKKIVDANGRPTGVATEASMVTAILDMLVQGLNVQKKQCYFIVRGNQLTLMRSYFGEEALAKRLVPGIAIYSDVVVKGEKIKKVKRRTRKGFVTVIDDHEMIEKRNMKEIEQCYTGAYLVDAETGEVIPNSDFDTTIMTMAEIRTSWSKSPQAGNANSFHNQQPDQACMRTTLRRFCKPIINASDDKILVESVRRQDLLEAEEDAKATIAAGANKEVLTLPDTKRATAKVVETEFAPEPEAAAQAPAAPVETAATDTVSAEDADALFDAADGEEGGEDAPY